MSIIHSSIWGNKKYISVSNIVWSIQFSRVLLQFNWIISLVLAIHKNSSFTKLLDFLHVVKTTVIIYKIYKSITYNFLGSRVAREVHISESLWLTPSIVKFRPGLRIKDKTWNSLSNVFQAFLSEDFWCSLIHRIDFLWDDSDRLSWPMWILEELAQVKRQEYGKSINNCRRTKPSNRLRFPRTLVYSLNKVCSRNRFLFFHVQVAPLCRRGYYRRRVYRCTRKSTTIVVVVRPCRKPTIILLSWSYRGLQSPPRDAQLQFLSWYHARASCIH